MKKVLPILAIALFTLSSIAQTARVQVIHNSSDAAASTVDVYINGNLALDDFAFRTATPFLDLPAGVQIEIAVAPGNSTSVGDAIITVPVTLTANEKYVVVADGIASPTGYNPAPPLTLQVFPMAREMASNSANVDVLVHHGSTDAPTVDVVETGAGAGTIVDNISYSEFQGYLELPTADYVLDVTDATGAVTVARYQAPLATLGLDGAALTVLASGFLDPSQNSNGPAFGLYVASPLGGALLALPVVPLSVSDFDVSNFSIYPNPTSEKLNINTNGIDLSQYSMIISDMLGRQISKGVTNSDNSIIVSNLNKGIYNLTILDGNSVIANKKFVKN
ncbi:hypothetical protein Aeqsu_0245 [Aequorivita sublithincola DSM 14238]|uniref:Secretion system C-terminal sorting domain-containing protein n=1 Tax=Aequorivita sublithincola (strain DSM 14238 / LMG 21431 / ACAM 643 / 9-3) TaxID=746697 RepID=I3YS00_AEQSU|nr:DUF4397 domain-containing protein [Aequorivita sublithincola]AFL79768.1 hypothetical protein Aeqsu_0245 [Aequorivita sublithincola DSM 14238]